MQDKFSNNSLSFEPSFSGNCYRSSHLNYKVKWPCSSFFPEMHWKYLQNCASCLNLFLCFKTIFNLYCSTSNILLRNEYSLMIMRFIRQKKKFSEAQTYIAKDL